jgi:hypothetical protein
MRSRVAPVAAILVALCAASCHHASPDAKSQNATELQQGDESSRNAILKEPRLQFRTPQFAPTLRRSP